MLLRLTHVFVSPLIFIGVYVGYNFSGSREVRCSFHRTLLGSILIMNLRFPAVGAFMGEVYIVFMIRRLCILRFALIFIVIGVAHIKLFYLIRGYVINIVLSPLVVLVIVY